MCCACASISAVLGLTRLPLVCGVQLLKKAIKRKQKLKERSQKKWGERLANQEAGKAQKQEKREANLKKRKDGPAAVAAAEEAAGGKVRETRSRVGKKSETGV